MKEKKYGLQIMKFCRPLQQQQQRATTTQPPTTNQLN